jgi:hypothetical protein
MSLTKPAQRAGAGAGKSRSGRPRAHRLAKVSTAATVTAAIGGTRVTGERLASRVHRHAGPGYGLDLFALAVPAWGHAGVLPFTGRRADHFGSIDFAALPDSARGTVFVVTGTFVHSGLDGPCGEGMSVHLGHDLPPDVRRVCRRHTMPALPGKIGVAVDPRRPGTASGPERRRTVGDGDPGRHSRKHPADSSGGVRL